MRILHTSDWHLGRTFKNTGLVSEQERFIDQVVSIVSTEDIDLLVVAGDVFDRSLPPAESVALWHEALVRTVDSGARVVAISGNHDQGERIEIPREIARDGIVVRGKRTAEPELFEFEDGPLLVVPIPFLDPFLARDLIGEDGVATHEMVLKGALAPLRQTVRNAERSLAVSHSFVRGGLGSDSERSLLQVGGAELVAPNVFEGFSYTALGHLHRPQEVGGNSSIAYSGSPLPYSFSETDAKTLRLIDMSPDGSVRVELLPVEAGWPVVTLKGTFDELVKDPDYQIYESKFFVRAVLTDPVGVPGVMDRLRQRFEGIAEVTYGRYDDRGAIYAPEPEAEMDPLSVVRLFWEDVTGRAASVDELELLDEAIRVGFGLREQSE